MMKQEDALRAILAEWRARPESGRRTESQLTALALRMADKYVFRCSGDRYQHIIGYLTRHTPGLKKLGL